MAKKAKAGNQGNGTQEKLGLDNPVVNNGLFADNYLKQRIKDLPEWKQVTDDELKLIFDKIVEIYHKHAVNFTDDTNEAVTEKDFIMPVLDVLWCEPGGGDCYQVQQVISIPDTGKRKPDYAMFASAEDRSEADQRAGSLGYWKTAVGLGDAKRWDLSLDKMRGQENPSGQITSYLYRAKVRWGILTNGVKWRLYEREASSGGGIYFEIDLRRIIQNKDLKGFRWFYMFFRRQSFIQLDGRPPFVEQVLQGSAQYAAEVSDSLKESVYDALRSVMNGVLAEPGNGVSANNTADLKRVHEIALIILYRLLFLMYAEDRKLLPIDTDPYRDMSLRTVHREINRKLREGKSYFPGMFQLWPKLRGMWEIIDNGLKDKGKWIIPAYNGGLFSADHFPEIPHAGATTPNCWRIGDSFIADAIDMLGYTRKTWNEPGDKDIDYATLDVRHLGGIYEGLLELAPALADEDLVEVWDGKKLAFKPEADVKDPGKKVKGQPPRRIAKGEVYLVTDRGERKATGSYYTPAYIVNYIVEYTIGPLAEQARKQTDKLFNEVVDEIEAVKKQLKEKGDNPQERKKLSNELRLARQRILKPYLDLNILDPAMGSGHFLVGAADFLSREMAFDTAVSLVYEDEELADPQAHFKRLVVEHCLYGVDLNPLAVELAKLSLWLHTVSRDKALSFLDHHLRVGNSLIGARIEEDLAYTPPSSDPKQRKKAAKAGKQQLIGFQGALEGKDLALFLDKFREIIELPTDTAKDEHKKQLIYAGMDKVRAKYRAVANLWLAPFFGVKVTDVEYAKAINALKGTATQWQELEEEQWFADAQAIANEKRFFHWELAFPEVFFESKVKGEAGFKHKDARGFDAVVGNPPYVRVQQLSYDDTDCFKSRYRSALKRIDIAILFIEQALRCLAGDRDFSFICSSQFMFTEYGAEVRGILSENCIREILDFSDSDIFEEALTYACILIVRKAHPANILFRDLRRVKSSVLSVQGISGLGQTRTVAPEELTVKPWHLMDTESQHLIALIKNSKAERLAATAELRYGVLTGADNVLIAEADQFASIERALQVPIAFPAETTKYCLKPPPKHLIYPYRETSGVSTLIQIAELAIQYPQTAQYLSVNKTTLQNRRDSRGDFSSDVDWHRLVRFSSWSVIESEKILMQSVAKRPSFALDPGGCAFIGKGITGVIPGKQNTYYLLAILNSRITEFFMKHTSPPKHGGYVTYSSAYLGELPIRKIDFTTPEDEREQLVNEAKALYIGYLRTGNAAPVLKHVAARLAHDPEQADVVHDLLAHLAEEMTQLNKEKQQVIRAFLDWLGDSALAGQDIEELTGKTKLKEYYKHDVAELIAQLRKGKNKKLLAARDVDPAKPAFHAMLKAAHEDSVKELNPLLGRIQATDELIDQTVYKLYGLTDEEIAIVEGKS